MHTPYTIAAPALLESGLGPIPLMQFNKRPGVFEGGNWHGMTGWQQYNQRLPIPDEVREWSEWPNANVGLPLGAVCGVVALDFDCGPLDLREKIEALVEKSPCGKIGAKGYTTFYRFSGEESRKWTVNNESVCELLSIGRQTVLPPSRHPTGCTYRWMGDDLATVVQRKLLPALPADFIQRVDEIVAAWGGNAPRRAVREAAASGDFWRETNDRALTNLSLWVPELLGNCCRFNGNGGYKAIAYWRGGDGWNVGIHPEGIRDFARDETLTPIDLVMRGLGLNDLHSATQWLRERIGLPTANELAERGRIIADALIADLQRRTEEERANNTAQPLPATEAPARKPRHAVVPTSDEILSGLGSGLLGKMVREMTKSARMPQPWLALGGALAGIGAVAGQRYATESDARTNLYVAAVARTGGGKDFPRQYLRRALGAPALLPARIGTDRLKSGQSLHRGLMVSPCVLLLLDEYGIAMQAMTKQHASAYMQEAKRVLLELYSSSGGSVMLANDFDKVQKIEQIDQPCLCIYGTTTQQELWDGYSSRDVSSGLLNRHLYFVGNDNPVKQRSEPARPSEEVVAGLRAILAGHPSRRNDLATMTGGSHGALAAAGLLPVEPYRVPTSETAHAVLDAFEADLAKRAPAGREDDWQAFTARAVEQAWKVALIRAVSDSPSDPLIGSDATAWGCALVTRCVIDLWAAAERYMADTAVEGISKRMEQMILKAGEEGIAHREVTRFTRSLTNRERQDALTSLTESGLIAQVQRTTGGRSKTVYLHYLCQPKEESAQNGAK